MMNMLTTNQNLIIYFTISTLVLYFGPTNFFRLFPGFRNHNPIVETKQGPARGEQWVSRGGQSFHSFRGIPYAKPPVGRRRFKLPEPFQENDRWSKVRDFASNPPSCPQLSVLGIGVTGNEDCLYLNVYTPTLSQSALLPVLVYVHGGGFAVGECGSSVCGPHNFMDKEVVLVTLHYRLGPLGFLSLESDNMQGNQGLWDQREALLWVKKNIKEFGGNPKQVTLLGESAGAMSVGFHLTSPFSQGLFHRAILQSGSSLTSALKPSRSPSYYALKLGESVGCTDESSLIPCLQDTPVKQIIEQTLLFDECGMRSDYFMSNPGPWIPVSDPYADKSFIPQDPGSLVEQGLSSKIPVLIGFNEAEGLLYSTRFIKDTEFYQYFKKNLDKCLVLNTLSMGEDGLEEKVVSRAHQLVKEYNGIQDGEMINQGFTDMVGDARFILSAHQHTELLRNQNHSVYRYIFSYVGSSSYADIFSSSLPEIIFKTIKRYLGLSDSLRLGASHVDELIYLFSNPLLHHLPSQEDQLVSENMIKWWTNFAKSGNPNGNLSKRKKGLTGAPDAEPWKPVVESAEFEYWVINQDSRMVSREDLKERFDRWK